MSLFGKLIQLHSDEHRRLEDFHTEIVAHVLASDSELTLRWLRKLGVTEVHEADEIAVITQQEFEPIEGLHSFGSKPDITIRLRKESRVEAAFIESKVGSEEGLGQLSRYMAQLRALPGVAQRALVFITRDYDPKEDLSDELVRFFQVRWSDFYHFLRTIESPSDTIRELLKFMQKNNMSQSNQRPAITQAMLKFSEGSNRAVRKWDNWDLSNDREWAGVGCTVNLEDFLATENHVAAITKWFEDLLDDAAAFRKQNLKLPWSVRAAEGEDK